MKKLIHLFFAMSSFAIIHAQTHYCADHKAQRFNKLQAAGQSVKKTAQSTAVPKENMYDLKFYHLNVNVERNTLFISGNVKSLAKVVTPTLDSFAFVLHENHTIDSVYVNGAKRNFIRRDSLVTATAGTPIPQNQLFYAIVYYKGTCPTGGSAAIGDGYNMATSPSWGNQVTWSLSEAICAYQWFPCKQDLRDKIDSSWVYATTDSANMVGSNGRLKNVVTIGNKKRYEWKSKYPIDYYLISVATAKYKPYILYAKPQYLVNDSIYIQNFVYDNAINNSTWINGQRLELNKIVPTIELQSKLFGMYPFYKEKYGHCMAPLGGGMEHQTMTSLGFFDFELDAHELGHQWWGDHVTCAAWKDIFINEGWASYTEYLCHQYMTGTGTTPVQKMLDVHNNVMSQTGGSCYFTNADTMNSNVIFSSRLTYDKGSAVIHSLRYEINNDSVFFPAIRSFQAAYSFSTASVIDFKNHMQTQSGQNFAQFFNQWYYGEGYPTFAVSWNQGGGVFYLKSTQTTSKPTSIPLFMTHVDYRITRTAKPDTIVRLYHGQNIENYSFPLTGTVTSIGVDPNNWILNKVGTNTHDLTLSASEIGQELANVFVGPNPTSDALNIYLYNNDKATVEIFDVTGKHMLTQSVNAHAEFDISKYANGVYTVSIKDKNGNILKTSKVVKN
ncbi:MAG: M1 family aminopeptidase [Bacteroidota bacterium]